MQFYVSAIKVVAEIITDTAAAKSHNSGSINF
ncbi:MAG: hypothetical protein K0R75_3657 [Paenibacillaceae bacterium]|nr:hypothetical protein [Paenibacillaceae bacterium]